MRFFSSSALARAEKLRLAANCSAAETISRSGLTPPRWSYVVGRGCKFHGPRRRPSGDLFFRLGGENRHRAAGLFDRGDRRLGGAGDRQRHLGLELAVAEQAHAVLGPPQDAGLDQRLRVDRRLGVELAGIDRLLNAAEIDLVERLAERFVEAAFGQPPVQRHLAALEALHSDAGAGLLALDAAPGGLALAGANPAADAAARLAGARAVGDFRKLHRTYPRLPHSPTTRTRWRTLVIMPRVAGVSGRSLTRPILLRPSPIRVLRWTPWRRDGLPICSIRTVFLSAMRASS